LYDGLPKPLGGSTRALSAFSLFGTQLETESLLGGRYLHICVVIEGFIDYQHEMLKLCDRLIEIWVLTLVYFLDVTWINFCIIQPENSFFCRVGWCIHQVSTCQADLRVAYFRNSVLRAMTGGRIRRSIIFVMPGIMEMTKIRDGCFKK
jgi:hypothetical protein